MINYDLYHPIESKVISNKNRFALKKKDLTEIKKDFFNSSILVTWGAGSIGSQFKNFKPSKNVIKVSKII
tara:strand:- start:116 stop:325 length:210 start_codon:yes stop_codon:yes gene_type:complete